MFCCHFAFFEKCFMFKGMGKEVLRNARLFFLNAGISGCTIFTWRENYCVSVFLKRLGNRIHGL